MEKNRFHFVCIFMNLWYFALWMFGNRELEYKMLELELLSHK